MIKQISNKHDWLECVAITNVKHGSGFLLKKSIYKSIFIAIMYAVETLNFLVLEQTVMVY